MSGKKERKKKSFLVPKIHKRREFCLCSRVCALLMHFLVRCGLRESCGCESNDGIQAQEKGKGKGKGKKTLKISKRRVCVCAREQTNMCTFGFSSVCLFVRRHGPLSLSCEVIVNGARGHQLPHRHTPSLSPCGRCVSFPPFPYSFPHTHISTLCFVFLPLGPPLIDTSGQSTMSPLIHLSRYCNCFSERWEAGVQGGLDLLDTLVRFLTLSCSILSCLLSLLTQTEEQTHKKGEQKTETIKNGGKEEPKEKKRKENKKWQ